MSWTRFCSTILRRWRNGWHQLQTSLVANNGWHQLQTSRCSPTHLNHTMFYIISQHFRTWGRQEHHQICGEQLKLVKKPNGESHYIELDRRTQEKNKTRRTGEEGQRGSSKKFAHRGICCPVKHWLPNLTSLGRPVLDPTEALQGKKTWYSETPVGVNKINLFLKNMTVEAGLSTTSKHFTNHSIRKTTVEKLQIAGVLNDNIASITGHKNEKSLKDYAETDIDDHVAISIILSQPVTTQPYGPFHMQPPSIPYVQLPTVAPCMSLQNAVPHVQLPTSFILCMQLQYSFNSCSVYFGGSCTTSIELNCNPSVPSRKHPHLSDEWYFISVYRTWVWTYVIFIIINL